MDKDNVKALYYCGLSKFETENYKEAYEFIHRAYNLDKNNIDVSNAYVKISKKYKAVKEKEKAMFSKLFNE